MSHSLISLADAGKRYTKFEDAPMLVSAALRFRARTKRSQLWAVRHVDLDVAPGECIGVIGRNGSGKSTLLQMLAGVTAPTEGRVSVRGKVAPLISVGVGFHPELTGRENIFVNAAILGLSRADVEARLDAIVDFADIAGFVDTPVKFYSSGMFVRLGFAVAINVDPQVLLIDEVLAVGDLAFQMKCFDKMAEIRDAGTTVVVVSHNLNAVRRMCGHTLVLHNGAPRFYGATADAISLYHQLLGEERDLDDAVEDDSTGSVVRGLATVDSWQLLAERADAQSGDVMRFAATISFAVDMDDPVFAFNMQTERGVMVYGENARANRVVRAGDRITLGIEVKQELVAGSYKAGLAIADGSSRETVATARPVHFFVHGRNDAKGVADFHAGFDFS